MELLRSSAKLPPPVAGTLSIGKLYRATETFKGSAGRFLKGEVWLLWDVCYTGDDPRDLVPPGEGSDVLTFRTAGGKKAVLTLPGTEERLALLEPLGKAELPFALAFFDERSYHVTSPFIASGIGFYPGERVDFKAFVFDLARGTVTLRCNADAQKREIVLSLPALRTQEGLGLEELEARFATMESLG